MFILLILFKFKNYILAFMQMFPKIDLALLAIFHFFIYMATLALSTSNSLLYILRSAAAAPLESSLVQFESLCDLEVSHW